MPEVGDKRRVECHKCGAEVVFVLQESFNAPDIRCGQCGEQLTDHKLAQSLGENLTLEAVVEAWVLARKYTYAQMMDLARKAFDDPDSLTPAELEALLASVRLRAAGLPSHASEPTN